LKGTAIIIQARTGSTRLPGKMLLPFFKEQSIFDLILERLTRVFGKENIILATTDSSKDDVLADKVKQENIKVFRGSENDVLKRFIDCAEKFHVNDIIRVCADNPFIDTGLMKELIGCEEAADYISFKIGERPSIKTHYGFFAERVTLAALKKANAASNEQLYHEHVTNYIYTYSSDFKIKWLLAPELIAARSDIRLTIDTLEDFETCKEIYSRLPENFSYEDVIHVIDNIPGVTQKMTTQIEKNGK
jgi:spore coat polysaccharide biosynthesis protein SpsF (cytidylyltransferase family)